MVFLILMKGNSLEQFSVGQTSSMSHTVTADEIEMFARASGDTNPVHLDAAYAATTRFGRRIAHGLLTASYISAVLGTQFPGPGTVYLKQDLSFLQPVYLGDTITVKVSVTQYEAEKGILTLETDCYNQRGVKVLTGEAVCLVSEVGLRPAPHPAPAILRAVRA
jgi:3-hydroxybutyryl-CoA dehydratase